MISDAVQPNPQVQSEHSYSLANTHPDEFTLSEGNDNLNISFTKFYILAKFLSILRPEISVDSVQPDMTSENRQTEETQSAVEHLNNIYIKSEPVDTALQEEVVGNDMSLSKVTLSTRPRTLLRPIYLATAPQQSNSTPLRKITVEVKTEPQSNNSYESSTFWRFIECFDFLCCHYNYHIIIDRPFIIIVLNILKVI